MTRLVRSMIDKKNKKFNFISKSQKDRLYILLNVCTTEGILGICVKLKKQMRCN